MNQHQRSNTPNPASGYVRPRTVWITNEGFHDYSSLAEYGQTRAITRGNVDYRYTDRLRARITETLAEMTVDDLICISGSPVITLEVAAIVMQKFGHIRYLYWEPLYNRYLERITDGTSREVVSDVLGTDGIVDHDQE